jgi:hypothetical protein
MKRFSVSGLAVLGGVAALVCAGPSALAVEPASDSDVCQQIGSYQVDCSFPVGSTLWTVPKGVTSIDVDLLGAAGGNGTSLNLKPTVAGGKGGHLKVTLPVRPGDKYLINTGGKGNIQGGFNGGAGGPFLESGGGGGASDVRTGYGLETRILVAGGGGGGGSYSRGIFQSVDGGGGGGGGAASPNDVGEDGTSGAWFLDCEKDEIVDGRGGGRLSGGGGGGYYGGGGGYYIGGGGGGSGYVDPTIKPDQIKASQKSVNPGDGKVTITYWVHR